MNSQILTIARKEFGDRFRSGWVLGCIVVWLAAICLTSFFGLIQVGRIGFQGYERTVLSLLNLAQYLVPLLALLLAHDLIVGEREERTLGYLVANGVARGRIVAGKYLGVALALAVSLILGFAVAGAAVGYGAKDAAFGPFLRLAATSLVLGLVFAAFGLAISCLARSRVQSLVLSFLLWGGAVYAFDLVALGALVSLAAPVAQKEIDIACDPTHVNAVAADVHAAFDAPDARQEAARTRPASRMSWVWINPVDSFRASNLEPRSGAQAPLAALPLASALWIAGALFVGQRKLRKIDL